MNYERFFYNFSKNDIKIFYKKSILVLYKSIYWALTTITDIVKVEI